MKRVICVIICIALISNIVMVEKADAANSSASSADYGFIINENRYNVKWYETEFTSVYQNVDSKDKDFKKDIRLGRVKVAIGVATTRGLVNGNKYQRIMLRADMCPEVVKNSKKGMSQDLVIDVCNSPAFMQNMEIQPATEIGETSYTVSNTLTGALGFNIGISNEGVQGGGNISGEKSVTNTQTFTKKALEVTTNLLIGNSWSRWEYDYVSGSNSTQNKYLYGSSVQKGLLSWRSWRSSSYQTDFTLDVFVKFGGGDSNKNDGRVKSKSGSYILGTRQITLKHCNA